MSLEIQLQASQGGGGSIISDRRLCLASDRHTVVEETDVRAASLLCPAGGMISSDDAARLCLELVDGKVQQRPAETSETKQAEKPEDKQREQPEDKSKSSSRKGR